jgi:hypothetical protein
VPVRGDGPAALVGSVTKTVTIFAKRKRKSHEVTSFFACLNLAPTGFESVIWASRWGSLRQSVLRGQPDWHGQARAGSPRRRRGDQICDQSPVALKALISGHDLQQRSRRWIFPEPIEDPSHNFVSSPAKARSRRRRTFPSNHGKMADIR